MIKDQFCTDHFRRIVAFHVMGKQLVNDCPQIPEEKVRRLRASLVLEEAFELINALGYYVRGDSETEGDDGYAAHVRVGQFDYYLYKGAEPDLVQIADGCADVQVVVTGTLVSCGIPDKPLLELVDGNNLDKYGPGGWIRDDGKVMKPPNHKPPAIAELIAEFTQGWQDGTTATTPGEPTQGGQ